MDLQNSKHLNATLGKELRLETIAQIAVYICQNENVLWKD